MPMKRTARPVQYEAEAATDFPDKFYMRSFSRGAKFEALAENDGLLIKLVREGEDSRAAEMHLHHLLAGILTAWAESLSRKPPVDDDHRKTLLGALASVEKAVKKKRRR